MSGSETHPQGSSIPRLEILRARGGVALLIGAAILLATNRQQIREIYIFAAVLVLQSLPFLSALAIAALEGARINDFAYWRRIEARIAELIPRRALLPKAPVPADKPIEPLP